jgi:hypothetical protein
VGVVEQTDVPLGATTVMHVRVVPFGALCAEIHGGGEMQVTMQVGVLW